MDMKSVWSDLCVFHAHIKIEQNIPSKVQKTFEATNEKPFLGDTSNCFYK